MDKKLFDQLVKTHGLRGRSVEACKRVLVDKETAYAVSKSLGLSESTISRALKRLNREICNTCGQPIK